MKLRNLLKVFAVLVLLPSCQKEYIYECKTSYYENKNLNLVKWEKEDIIATENEKAKYEEYNTYIDESYYVKTVCK